MEETFQAMEKESEFNSRYGRSNMIRFMLWKFRLLSAERIVEGYERKSS